ncbi:MAG: AAA family ATPase [Christensenellaceae bacterium]|jgi:predicted AAA+ superfamily ATPase|nr:AAA family ATPase [Christensenellaceae bacterium]
MLKRKIESDLLAWKNQNGRKNALLIKGARQVGKTFIVDKFGLESYKSFIRMNFEENKTLREIFAGDLDIETLRKQITLNIPNAELIPGETLIFLDEIQSCPNARTALKFIVDDGRYDVIASGSLLGINYKEVSSYPTGYEDEVIMRSLDFEEYLWAIGINPDGIAGIKGYFDSGKRIPEAMNNKMLAYLREYIVIGGMPAVVAEFIETADFNKALKRQRAIIANYLNDIAKYAEAAERVKARACFLSMPRQLAKENKKFQYKVVDKTGSARKYDGSVMWLADAGIVDVCNNLDTPEAPLSGNTKPGYFKLYMQDIGLLVAMLDDGTAKEIIDGNLGIYKGAIYENLIATILAHNGKKLYYYAEGERFEVDFVTRIDREIFGIEVKSNRGKATSLQVAMRENPHLKGIKLEAGNIGEIGGVKTMPLYMAMFL